MSDFKIGLVVDFSNYKEFYPKFHDKYKSRVIEFHITEKNLDHNFPLKIDEIKRFLLDYRITDVAFHSPDRLIQSVLFEEKSDGLENDKKSFYLLMDELKRLSNEINDKVMLIFHQGIKLPKDFLANLSDQEVDQLRKDLLQKAKKGYNFLINYIKDSRLLLLLENSPPSCATDLSEHFIDVAFEDIESRIKNNGFVFDFSHAAMSVEYFKQKKAKFISLEALKREYKGVPKSLSSIEDYVKKAAKNICWLHLNDANGIYGENEGLVLGIKDSLINLKILVSAIKKEVINPKGVLEIVGGHKDYKLIELSMDNFINKCYCKI